MNCRREAWQSQEWWQILWQNSYTICVGHLLLYLWAQARGGCSSPRARIESQRAPAFLLPSSRAALLTAKLWLQTPNELCVVECSPVTLVLGRLRLQGWEFKASLTDPVSQHPEQTVDKFPISLWVYNPSIYLPERGRLWDRFLLSWRL